MSGSEHFSDEELRCPHCQKNWTQPALYDNLEELRQQCGDIPLKVLSGYRCPTHNDAVGGSKKSQHTWGLAADIQCPDSMTLEEFYCAAVRTEGFKNGGIGVYPKGFGQNTDFLHVDVRGSVARWSRINGKYETVEKGFQVGHGTDSSSS
jgi:uncharacterized protein YcbK (DUF882 family)